MTDKKKPESELRIGKLKAVIWKNETENGERYNVQFKRIYRLPEEQRTKKDNGWRESDSFGRDDLLVLAKLADLVHSKLFELNQTEGEAA